MQALARRWASSKCRLSYISVSLQRTHLAYSRRYVSNVVGTSHLPSLPPPTSSPLPSTVTQQAPRRRRKYRWLVRSTALVVVFVGGIFVFSHPVFEKTLFDPLWLSSMAIIRFVHSTTTLLLIIADYKFSPADEVSRSQSHQRSAERLLHLAQAHGGFYVKAAQYVSSLRPAIPSEFTETLSVLTDAAPARPLPRVLATLNESLSLSGHDDYRAVFTEFDPIPIGVASLAQVHRAVLHNGAEVAVKIQHSNVTSLIDIDLFTFRSLMQLTAFIFPSFSFLWVYPEIRTNIRQELNFIKEAENAIKCKEYLRSVPDVYVPFIYTEYTTSTVLIMEYIRGVKVKTLRKQHENEVRNKNNNKKNNTFTTTTIPSLSLNTPNFDRKAVAYIISNMFATLIYKYGFVHCDPHEGNLLIRENKLKKHTYYERFISYITGKPLITYAEVVLLDHGMYRILDETFRLNYCLLWDGMIRQDRQTVDQACTAMGIQQYSDIMSVIFTHRTLSSTVRLGQSLTDVERLDLRSRFNFNLANISSFMQALPRDMLFVLRTLNLVRGLNYELGGESIARFRVYGEASIIGLYPPGWTRWWRLYVLRWKMYVLDEFVGWNQWWYNGGKKVEKKSLLVAIRDEALQQIDKQLKIGI